MSPRAAWRLISLGFSEVYDYVAGEADWFALGLPREGRDAGIPRAGDVARRDVPACRLTDRADHVLERLQAADWDMCLVVNEERVVLGRVKAVALAANPTVPIEKLMEAGPTTVRPDARLAEVLDRMQDKHVRSMVVTTSDGRMVGVLQRDDGEERPACERRLEDASGRQ